MKPDIKKKWLEALRSGEYKQVRDTLKSRDGYCCLGVLCDIHSKVTGNNWQGVNLDNYFDHYSYLPTEVIYWADLRSNRATYEDRGRVGFLSSDNDNGKTFLEIADIIEKHF